MKKILAFTALLVVFALAFATGNTVAKPSQATDPQFRLPDNAKQVSRNVYYLGKADYHGREVEGYAVFARKDELPAKPGTECGNGMCEPGENKNNCSQDCGSGGGDDGGTTSDTSSCYGFLARDAEWKTAEPWKVNAKNSANISDNSVLGILNDGAATWENAVDGGFYDILGPGYLTDDVLVADTESPDGVNEVYFADISSDGAVGVTIVWGYFSGPPFGRELIEWDQIYDDFDYDWSADCSVEGENCVTAEKMDFPSVAVHELGHSVGLDDLYDDKCQPATMYGYVDYGETKARDLIDGDINGVSELY